MNRFRLLTLLSAMFVLLLLPASAAAQVDSVPQVATPAPKLNLLTDAVWLELIYGQPTGPVTAPILFENTGAGPLIWDVFVSAYGCGRTDSPAWLSVSPGKGNLRPKHATSIIATINLAHIEIGPHEASICMRTNDPQQPFAAIPVYVAVYPPPPAP